MNKYRKIPVEVEAVQWKGNNIYEVLLFMYPQKPFMYPQKPSDCFYEGTENMQCLMIETLEGEYKASQGDFIIKGVKGEFYPCKPDIFKMTYEKV